MVPQNKASFTLIELLIVIAIVAVLAVVVVITLNPGQLLKQARDSTRLSDLALINKALSIYQVDQTMGSLGSSSVVYVSMPDYGATTTQGTSCEGISGLPVLPPNYTYHCAASSTLRNVDGQGWIPVNFNQVAAGSPFSQLPVDPVNTTSSRNYYTYTPGGSWELTAALESDKNKMGGTSDKTSGDGGTSPGTYEIGNDLTLQPIDYGDSSLIAYYPFDESSGTTVYDYSGWGFNANASGGVWAAGQKGGAIDFPLTNIGTVTLAVPTSTYNYGEGAVSFWYKPHYSTANPGTAHWFYAVGQIYAAGVLQIYNNGNYQDLRIDHTPGTIMDGTVFNPETWYHITYTWNSSGNSYYLNGTKKVSISSSWTPVVPALKQIRIGITGSSPSDGAFDDVRIYNRRLSPEEIAIIYNSGR